MPTERIQLSNQSYTDLGAGPRHIFVLPGNGVRLHFGASVPDVGTDNFIPETGPKGRDYQGSEVVYARAEGDSAFVVVVSEPV